MSRRNKEKKLRKRGKKINRSIGGDICIFLVLAIVGIFMALPFVYAIVQSLKPLEEIFLFPPRFFVRNPTFDNFFQLSQLTNNLWVPFSRYIFNSFFITIVSTVFHVIFASMAAYPLAKQNVPGGKIIFAIITMALLFNASVTMLPQYIIMSKMSMINTVWALIIPPIGAPLGLFLMKQFMEQIDKAIIEAGKIDGASTFRVFWNIVMPNVKPAWLTLVIFSFQASWNREGLEFIYDENLKVLPTILKQISSSGMARAGVGSAAAVLLMIPPIVTFLVVQSNVLETMSHSGIK